MKIEWNPFISDIIGYNEVIFVLFFQKKFCFNQIYAHFRFVLINPGNIAGTYFITPVCNSDRT